MSRSGLPMAFMFIFFTSSLGFSQEKPMLPLEHHLGQLLYVNVDGFGASDTAIHEDYFSLVEALNIGGVLAHFGTKNTQQIQTAIARLHAVAGEPLLVGIDFAKITAPISGAESWVGLGFGAGILGIYAEKLNPRCLEELFYLQALCHRILGINHPLGPTVDRSARFGSLNREAAFVEPLAKQLLATLKQFKLVHALKHFPYTPDSFSLHKASLDTALTLGDLQKKTAIFQALAPHTDMVMTTHLYHSQVDPVHFATFSEKWLAKLRATGFKGLVITDGLLMIRDYKDAVARIKNHWDQNGIPAIQRLDSIFAIQAIMAGHDLVILEGTSADTRAVYRDLKRMLQHPSPLGQAFRIRVGTATARIRQYKNRHKVELSEKRKISDAVLERSVLLMNQILIEAEQLDHSSLCDHKEIIENLKRQFKNEEAG